MIPVSADKKLLRAVPRRARCSAMMEELAIAASISSCHPMMACLVAGGYGGVTSAPLHVEAGMVVSDRRIGSDAIGGEDCGHPSPSQSLAKGIFPLGLR